MTGMLFDLDFTLIDATEDIFLALERALRPERIVAPSIELVRKWAAEGVGPMIANAIRSARVPWLPELQQRVMRRFLKIYAENPTRNSKVYPGVVAALTQFHDEGRHLGICTNKPEALTHRILDALHLDHFFKHVTGGDSTKQRMPDPEPLLRAANALGPSKACFVGVSENAAQAAHNAGMPFWYYDREGKSERPLIRGGRRFDRFEKLPKLIAESMYQLS